MPNAMTANVTRRRFIRDASIGAAAAGTAVAVGPGLLGATGGAAGADTTTKVMGTASSGGHSSSPAGTIVAQVVDAHTGTVAIFVGTKEIILRSPGLAQQLAVAAK